MMALLRRFGISQPCRKSQEIADLQRRSDVVLIRADRAQKRVERDRRVGRILATLQTDRIAADLARAEDQRRRRR